MARKSVPEIAQSTVPMDGEEEELFNNIIKLIVDKNPPLAMKVLASVLASSVFTSLKDESDVEKVLVLLNDHMKFFIKLNKVALDEAKKLNAGFTKASQPSSKPN